MGANAAISILNGTLCGRGASLAITGGVQATATHTPGRESIIGAPDRRIIDCLPTKGKTIEISSTFGPSRGLKTSSGSALALLEALQLPASVADAVALCRKAGVTITGAWDDQAAVACGGLHLADNVHNSIEASWNAPAWHVAVWHPDATIEKSLLPRRVPHYLEEAAERAANRIKLEGARAAPEVMNKIGDALMAWYTREDLPVNPAAVDVAREHGAIAASLSGTGPAVAALFSDVVDLPLVPGGEWIWQQTVPLERLP